MKKFLIVLFILVQGLIFAAGNLMLWKRQL